MAGFHSTTRLVVLVALVAVIAPAGVVSAAAPPPPPAAYYGSLTVNGEPAPAGVTVTAHINGEVRGSMTTTGDGAYGGPGAFDGKLQVDGTEADEGATVTFSVGGVRAATTVAWHASDVRRVDMAVTGDVSLPETIDGGGGGGGGGSGGGQPPQSNAGATVTVDRSADRTSVTVSNAGANEVVTVDLEDESENAADDPVSLDGIDIATTGGDFSLSVTQSADPPTDAPPVAESPAGAVGYIRIDHSVPDESISEVTFRFRVSTTRLTARGIDPDDVVLYRFHDGEWSPLETALIEETDGGYAFRTVSPGLSVFAIGSRQRAADIQVTAARLSTTEISVGDRVSVTATVENRGGVDGEIALPLLVDGQQVDETSVIVPAGETRTVSFEPRFDETGTVTVRVGDTTAGRLRVGGSSETTASDIPSTSGLGLWLAVVVALLITSVAAAYYLRFHH